MGGCREGIVAALFDGGVRGVGGGGRRREKGGVESEIIRIAVGRVVDVHEIVRGKVILHITNPNSPVV